MTVLNICLHGVFKKNWYANNVLAYHIVFVDIDNELSAKLDNQEEAACFIFCDGTGESCVFDFEQFNLIAEWDIEMHLKSVLGDNIDSEDIFDVLDVFFDLFWWGRS